MPATIRVDTSGFDAKMKRLASGMKDVSKPMRVSCLEYAEKVARDWQKMDYESLFSGPRQFRGDVTWEPVKPQYVRKTDGVAVPPWGGVPRIAKGWSLVSIAPMTGIHTIRRQRRVTGNVKAKLKSGTRNQRIAPTDIVNASSSGLMRSQFVGDPVLTENGRVATMQTSRPYASVQNERRPFAFFTKDDSKLFNDNFTSYLRELIGAVG